MDPETSDDFERGLAARRGSMAGELARFLAHTRKWWLLPILVVMLLLGVLMLLGGTVAAPFIYTLF
jgi:hypothetical protein